MDDLISRQATCEYCHDDFEGYVKPIEASCWGCNCQKMERLKEQKTFSEMVRLHDAETHGKLTETHSCDYCHEDSDGYVKPIEKNCHAVIFGSVLYLKAKGWRGEVQIKYCPMCGRSLER